MVDDNRSIRNVLSTLLRLMGFEVALAGNGIEALAVFHENSFDLVVTDPDAYHGRLELDTLH